MNSPSIAMLYCYFGKLPWYFDLFAHSCKYNDSIDFIIYTDQQDTSKLADNVIVRHITRQDFTQKAANKIGFDINLDYSYKLCDLKPAYGLIFEDDIVAYDYWGLGDIDIIFGNLRNFLENLPSVDIFCVRFEYVTGYFSLFRNTQTVTRLFEKSRDYRKVFQSSEHFCFDECNFQFTPLGAGIPIEQTSAAIDSMTHVVFRELKSGNIKAHFDMHAVEGIPGNLEFSEGTLSYKSTYEVMLYHLIAFKKHPLMLKPTWSSVPNNYAIEKHFMVRENSFSGISTFLHRVRIFVKRLSNIFKFALSVFRGFMGHGMLNLKHREYQSGSLLAKLSLKGKKVVINFTDTALANVDLTQIPVFEAPEKLTQLELVPIGKGQYLSAKKKTTVWFSFDSERKTEVMEIGVLNRDHLKFYSH